MNTQVPKEVLDRVSKLLTLAEDAGASDNEKEVAKRIAAEMMSKYLITSDDLKRGLEVYCETFPWWTYNIDTDAKSLQRSISDYFGVVALFSTGRPGTKRKGELYFYGAEADVKSAVYLFSVLLKQVVVLENEFSSDFKLRYGFSPAKKQWMSYRIGLIHGIDTRLKSLLTSVFSYKALREPGTALVPVSEIEEKQNLIKEALDFEINNTKNNFKLDHRLVRAGVVDSDKIIIHAPIQSEQSSIKLLS